MSAPKMPVPTVEDIENYAEIKAQQIRERQAKEKLLKLELLNELLDFMHRKYKEEEISFRIVDHGDNFVDFKLDVFEYSLLVSVKVP